MKKILIDNRVVEKLKKLPSEQKALIVSKISEDNLNEQRSNKVVNGEKIYKYNVNNEYNLIYGSSQSVINIIELENMTDKMIQLNTSDFIISNINEKEVLNIINEREKDKKYRAMFIEITSIIFFTILPILHVIDNKWLWANILPTILIIIQLFSIELKKKKEKSA
jgi:mRNA-degrading endonuclease RelE of RelBE toxin-antitoxin system